MKIEILGREVELKTTLRTYINYEKITGRSFNEMELNSLENMLKYMYATFLACGKYDVNDISEDDFMDYLDEDPSVIIKFSEWMMDCLKASSAMMLEVENETKKKTSETEKTTD